MDLSPVSVGVESRLQALPGCCPPLAEEFNSPSVSDGGMLSSACSAWRRCSGGDRDEDEASPFKSVSISEDFVSSDSTVVVSVLFTSVVGRDFALHPSFSVVSPLLPDGDVSGHGFVMFGFRT